MEADYGRNLPASSAIVLLNLPSVPLESTPGARSTRYVTKFHNVGHNRWGGLTAILFKTRV